MPGRYGNLGIGSYGGTPEEEDAIRRRVLRRGYGMADQLGLPEIDNPLADQIGKPPGLWSEDGSINPEGLSTLGTYLSGLGQGFLANSGYEPGVAPSFGQGLGAGVAKAEENYSSRLRQQVSDRVTGYQLKRQQRQDALEEQERQRQAAAQEQQQQLLGQLGPEYQTLAALGDGPAAQALKAQLFPDPVKPNSDIAQIQADVAAGFLTPEQAQAAIRKATYIAPQAQREDPLVAVETPQGPRLLPRSQAAGMAPARSDAADPLVAVQTPQGARLLPRSQAAGMAPAATGDNLQLVPVKGPNGETIYSPEQDAIGKPVGSSAAGAAQYRRMTAQEETDANLPPGPNYINLQTGLPEVVNLPSKGIVVGPDGSISIGGPAGGGVDVPKNYEPDPARPGAVKPIAGGPADPNTPTGATVSKQQAAKVAFNNLDGTLERIKTLVGQYGTELMPGEVKSELESLYGDALLQYKEVNALGALTGPDLPLMESILGSATSLGANIASMNPFGGNPALKKLKVFEQLLERSKKNSATLLGGGASPPPPPAVTDTTVKTPTSQAELDSYLNDLGL